MKLTRAWWIAVCLLLAGCGSAGESAVNYYLISPAEDAGGPLVSDLKIEIIDLKIPQYLERFQIASRRDDNQLVFASSHQWAENLRKNLLRTLAQNLTLYLGAADVGTPANRSASEPDVRVRLFIEQFERSPDGHVRLVARWQLTGGEPRETLTTRLGRYESPSPVDAKDFAGTVRAMGELFARLSKDLASAIESSVAGQGETS